MPSLTNFTLPSNFTALSSNVETPVNGGLYTIESLAFGHMFNLAFSDTFDGAVIQGFPPPSPLTSNMVIQFLTYPTTDNSVVATLQTLSTIDQLPSEYGGRGGYIRANTTINKLSQGAEPFAWKFTQESTGFYTISPFDAIYNEGGDLFVTDPEQEYIEPAINQLTLQTQLSELSFQQFWTFNEA